MSVMTRDICGECQDTRTISTVPTHGGPVGPHFQRFVVSSVCTVRSIPCYISSSVLHLQKNASQKFHSLSVSHNTPTHCHSRCSNTQIILTFRGRRRAANFQFSVDIPHHLKLLSKPLFQVFCETTTLCYRVRAPLCRSAEECYLLIQDLFNTVGI